MPYQMNSIETCKDMRAEYPSTAALLGLEEEGHSGGFHYECAESFQCKLPSSISVLLPPPFLVEHHCLSYLLLENLNLPI